VIARVWQARIDRARGHEYDAFAHTRSLPAFRAHDGFRGCAFLGDGAVRVVLTLWDSLEDVSALERSALYQRTVADIMAGGFILDATPAVTATIHGPPGPGD
jgi:heme-degrading monooxygenase HmoA